MVGHMYQIDIKVKCTVVCCYYVVLNDSPFPAN